MAIVNGYATADDIRAQMADSGEKLDQDRLDRAVSSASRAVDKYCKRRFWQDESITSRLYSASSSCELEVGDISTQDGLVVEVDYSGNGDWTTLDSDSYHLEPLNAGADFEAYAWWTIVIDSGSGFRVSRKPLVRVTAQWGWSEIPEEVVEATILKAVSLFKRKDSPNGIEGFSDFGPVRISKNDPDYVALLGPFKKQVIA
jgi:hypothetical protein